VKQRFIAAELAHGAVETQVGFDTILQVGRCRAVHVVNRAPQRGHGLSPVGPRRQLAGCQGLEGGANVEDVANFFGIEMAHRQPAPRTRRDQALLLQLTHRLPEGATTDLQRF
jgi:hypothetical protein